MNTRRKYTNLKNAPIKEAIISLTIGQQKHSSLQELEKLCAAFHDTYPQPQPWTLKEFAFQVNEAGTNTSHLDIRKGFVLSSEDQKKVLHLGYDSLSLNILEPYGSWEDFSSTYKAAWNIFTASLQIAEVDRLTIRYINDFSIPMQNWEEYLLLRPTFQSITDYDDSTVSMAEVFSRYVLISERHMAQSVVLLTLKPESNTSLRVTMDIEVSSRTPITDYSGYRDVEDVLNRLRDFKNQIFFSNLPKAEDLFS
jgi:uncharacterized protein (TIGR04255 family)